MEISQTHHADEYALSSRVTPFKFETQQKLMKMRIFLHGVTGLGIEIAKNLVLMSLKEITIFDNNVVTMKDVGRNFACREHHIGEFTRAEACIGYLKELNPNCQVKVINNEKIDFISNNYDCVVVVDNYNKDYLQRLNQACRQKNVGFILAGCLGLYGYTFVDFGNNHTVHDPTGEQLKYMSIKNITQSKHGVVQFDRKSNNLKDGDVVEFKDVEGMTELNGKQFQVKIISQFKLMIGDTTKFTAYKKGGYAKKINIPLELQFKSLSESLLNESILNKSSTTTNSCGHMDYPQQLHFTLNGVYDFYQKYSRLPRVLDEKESFEVFLFITQKRLEFRKFQKLRINWIDGVDQQIVKNVAMYANTQISPMCSFWGGIAAQQVVKFTGKYTPIYQWLHRQFFDCLPQSQNIPRKLLTENNRYNDYIAIFGEDFFRKCQSLKLLLIGAGSVGCQYLKMISLMGMGTGKTGKVTVVDDKKVLKRNLNSHFLLKNSDVGSYKACCATQAIKQLNASINVDSFTLSLEKENQDFFNQDFWYGHEFVIGAIGNQGTRFNLHDQCLWNQKPMIQGHIRGTECKSLIAIPHQTEPFIEEYINSNGDMDMDIHFYFDISKQIPQGKEDQHFSSCYEQLSSQFNMIFTQPNKLYDKYDKNRFGCLEIINKKLRKLKILHQINESKSYQACVQLMVDYFDKQFVKERGGRVTLISKQYELGEEPSGSWEQRMRQPEVLELCLQDPLNLQLIQSGANIYAQMMNIPGEQRVEEFLQIAHTVIKKLHLNYSQDSHKVQQEKLTDQQQLIIQKQLINDLLSLPVRQQNTPTVIKFNQENPNKWHTKFIEAAFQLRLLKNGIGIKQFKPDDNYLLTYLRDEFQPKMITTAAVLAGHMGMEMIKYQLNKPISKHNRISANLATSTFKFNRPNPAKVYKNNESRLVVPGGTSFFLTEEFTNWTKIDIKQPMLLCQLIQYLQQTYTIKVTEIFCEHKTVYNFYDQLNNKRRLVMRVEDEVQQVTRSKICRMKKVLWLLVYGEKNGTDCILPYIRYYITGKSH